MKRFITICVVAGLILASSDVAQANFTGWVNPTANSPGPSNWGFNTPTGAYTDGTGPDGWSSAMAMPGTMSGKPFNEQQYYGYGFSVPSGATIDGIQVRMDAWRNSYATTGSLAVELSWDGGTTWTTTGYTTGTLATGETTYTKGSSSITWGRTWTAEEINNTTNFRIRQTVTISSSNALVYLDWVPVGVTYTTGTPPNTPAPGAILLGSIGVGLVGWLRRRRTL